MIRRDFIIRLIEDFFQLLAKALGTFQKKDIPQAMAAVDLGYKRFLGLAPDFAERASVESLLALFRVDPDRLPAQCLIAAELMRARAMIRREQGHEEEALRLALRSIEFYLAGLPLPDPRENADYRPGLAAAFEIAGPHLPDEKAVNVKNLMSPRAEERG